MLRTLLFKHSKTISVINNIHPLDQWRAENDGFLWVHLEGKESAVTDKIKQVFALDDLSIADSLRDRHPPKYESYKSYDFILFRPLELNKETNEIIFSQLSLFTGKGFLISRSFVTNHEIDQIWQEQTQLKDRSAITPTCIICLIGRAIAAQYMQQIYILERELEDIENSLEHDIKDRYLSQLTQHNGLLRKMVRNLEYMERVTRKMKDSPLLTNDDEHEHKLVDLHDQMERGLSLSRMYQGLCNDLINAHISITSHRVNKVVKALTIVTVLFLPLSFIAGLYGMNFENIPELKLKYGYFYVLGFMLLIEISLIIVLRKVKWI